MKLQWRSVVALVAALVGMAVVYPGVSAGSLPQAQVPNAFSVVHAFGSTGSAGLNLGASPVTQASDGNFYGTTSGGSTGCGTLFRISPAGVITDLHYFVGNNAPTGGDGCQPNSGVIQGRDGFLYGTTRAGGNSVNCGSGSAGGCGTLFRVALDGSGLTLLHAFDSGTDGDAPTGRLLQASDGRLYGTTQAGAGGGGDGNACNVSCGSLYGIGTDGSGYTLVHVFAGGRNEGSSPMGIMQSSDGKFYGATIEGGGTGCARGCGTLYTVALDGSGFATLHAFTDSATGLSPVDAPIQASDGKLYGVTTTDFAETTHGTVYRMARDGSGFAVLHSFTGGAGDGATPSASLLQGRDGLLYGTTLQGGSLDNGTVFRMALNGSGYVVAKPFPDQTALSGPEAPLVQAADGNFYGTQCLGGSAHGGVIFRMGPAGPAGGISNVAVMGLNADGNTPTSNLALAADGKFYGTTKVGGSDASGAQTGGVAFQLAPDGSTYTPLYAFPANGLNGLNPSGGVIPGGDGFLYGTTTTGGPAGPNDHGLVFRLAQHPGTDTVLHAFGLSEGEFSQGPMLLGSNGQLYGTNDGALFTLHRDGSGFSVLHTFTGTGSDGVFLSGDLVQDSPGRIYGTTQAGGSGVYGTLYAINADGSGYTVLHPFGGAPDDGGAPIGGVTLGNDGMLYGTTAAGGASGTAGAFRSGAGTVFRMARDGSGLSLLHSFGLDAADGSAPAGRLLQAADGMFYGTTQHGGGSGCNGSGCGTVFRVAADGSAYAVVHVFSGGADGAVPYAGLTQGGDGRLYGTTQYGGIPGGGTAFALLFPPAAPAGLSATPGDGQVALSWSPVAGAASYNVYQGSAAGGESATPAQTGITGSSATVNRLSNGSTYYFVVRAVNAAGAGNASNEASATPQASSSSSSSSSSGGSSSSSGAASSSSSGGSSSSSSSSSSSGGNGGGGGGVVGWPVAVLLALAAGLKRRRARA